MKNATPDDGIDGVILKPLFSDQVCWFFAVGRWTEALVSPCWEAGVAPIVSRSPGPSCVPLFLPSHVLFTAHPDQIVFFLMLPCAALEYTV